MLCNGLSGSLFVDCIEHTVMDTTGEIYEPIMIKDIVKMNPNIFTIHCNSHNLSPGCLVKFSSLDANNADYFLNNCR